MSEEAIGILGLPGSVVTGGCELTEWGAGDGTQGSWKSSVCPQLLGQLLLPFFFLVSFIYLFIRQGFSS